MNKEERRAYKKAWYQANRESEISKIKVWNKSHREHCKDYSNKYKKSDLNSIGQTKHSIRVKSLQYLNKYGTKIPGYEIHHCCTYTEPYKFIYCSKEMHRIIHSYLKQHNIDADSNHYKYIKHLLDDSVVKYGID